MSEWTAEDDLVHPGGCNDRCEFGGHYLVGRRRLRDRVWFYRPGRWRPGWRIVQWSGGDEFDWHTLVVGCRWTGAVVIARHPCRGTGKCSGLSRDTEEDR